MIRFFKPATALLIALGTLLALPAVAQITTVLRQSAECRVWMHNRMRKVALIQLGEHGRCHRYRMQGKLSETTDCNDPADVVKPERIAYWVDKLRVPSRVCGPAVPPIDQGFTSCPPPCESISVATYDGVAACMACLTPPDVAVAAETIFGTPSLPATRKAATCQRRIMQAFSRYYLTRITEQRKCKLFQDYFEIPDDVDCRSADLGGRAVRALGRLQAIVTRCDDADLAALDSCGTTVAEEQACLAEAADLHSDALFDYVHP